MHGLALKEGYGAYDEVSAILAFVQSLRYTSDSASTGYDEYPRFPVETLVDDGGDCEDTAILFATLVLILDYNVVLINPPNHLAVGVWGDNLYGSYYTYNSRRYYYCETTGDGYNIGNIPSEYEGASAYLYSIDQSSQYIPDQSTTPTLGQDTALKNVWLIIGLASVAGGIVSIIYSLKKSAAKAKPETSNPPIPPPPPSDAQAMH